MRRPLRTTAREVQAAKGPRDGAEEQGDGSAVEEGGNAQDDGTRGGESPSIASQRSAASSFVLSCRNSVASHRAQLVLEHFLGNTVKSVIASILIVDDFSTSLHSV